MKRCVICGATIDDRHDFCRKCFESKIHELQLKYGQDEEGPSEQPGKEDGEAQASELFTEHTGH